MVTITTTGKSVRIDAPGISWNVVKSRIKGQIPLENGTLLLTDMGEMPLRFDDVSGNGEAFGSAEDLREWIETNCFGSDGGSVEGVQSIQAGPGIDIDDSDPKNPIVSSNFSNPKWDDVDEKPSFIAAGSTAAQARNAIDLGTASTQPAGAFATAAQGTKADSALQAAAIADMVESKREQGLGWPIKNYLAITQADYDALTVKDPQTEYSIVIQYPAP